MNLPPSWVEFLSGHGFEALHWSSVGDGRATDREIMQWALDNEYVVFTHDLDFTTLLAVTDANGPSILQLRSQDVLVDAGVPRAVREIVPVVADGDRVLWIPGIAVDAEAAQAGVESPAVHLVLRRR